MARAIIKSGFASPMETAEVLGVSRVDTKKLIRMAKVALSSNRRRSKAHEWRSPIAKSVRKRRPGGNLFY